MEGHAALDIPVPKWTKCYAAREGVVIEKETRPERGLSITIKHGPYQGGKYYTTCYEHLQSMKVDVGDRVSTGQLIGYTGNTGLSAGPHLHSR